MSAPTTLQPSATLVSGGETRSPQSWLVGPWFDALLMANIAWPLAVLLQEVAGFGGQPGLQFWQLYYVTTPHRWITLALVFLDRERFHERRGLFLAIAACAAAVCLGVRFTTGALTCLLAVDYLWNAWHFAAQHHGIYRIYGRLGQSLPPSGMALEKWGMRAFLLYVILRVASATSSNAILHARLQTLDWFALCIPAWLLLRELLQPRAGRLTYLMSVICLYLAMLWAVHERRLNLVLSLATASAVFHAIEYLSLVSWSVQKRHAGLGPRLGVLAHLAPRWGLALGAFLLILGAGGWLLDQHYLEAWLTINVIVAFLHYAYDGLIWRSRNS